MGYDIRMAGNWTCHVPSQPAPANFVSNYTTQWWSNTDRPLFGQDETTDNNAVGDASFPADYKSQALRGDTLIALRASADDTRRQPWPATTTRRPAWPPAPDAQWQWQLQRRQPAAADRLTRRHPRCSR